MNPKGFIRIPLIKFPTCWNGHFFDWFDAVSYTHLRAHETRHDLVCRLLLEKKKLVIDNLYLLASLRSAGSKINFNGKEYEVSNLDSFDFSKVKITFFAAGGTISENFVEKAAKHSLVIDNSSFYSCLLYTSPSPRD